MAVASAKKFLRTMAQPFGGKEQDGVSTWSLADLERHKEKAEEEKIRELRNGVSGSEIKMEGEDDFGDEDMDAAMMDVDT